ncbi:hypothetical protein N7449_010071 [Penicillium cf. viridicatum]|uniref:Uncharacterized protein n=1 Tax=Penicillium cf. viridicatum TaxID=2972119 RepID=A0A9W9IZW6_9EURO|nr:hypothetical protein N7449_010071 [Penicillium cf. viridicatum]
MLAGWESVERWAPGRPVPEAGEWANYIQRLLWGVAKEGDLVKSLLILYILQMKRLREPVVRPTMAMTSERWNEEIGGRIENIEALSIHHSPSA